MDSTNDHLIHLHKFMQTPQATTEQHVRMPGQQRKVSHHTIVALQTATHDISRPLASMNHYQ